MNGASTRRTVEVDGRTRGYRLYRPTGMSGRVPLVLVYHGLGGSAEMTERQRGWRRAADRHGFVVAFPQGAGAAFNVGNCCGTAYDERVDDVAAAHAIIDDVAGTLRVDRRRVYAAGFSNGGMMAYRRLCIGPPRRHRARRRHGAGGVREPEADLHPAHSRDRRLRGPLRWLQG